MADDDAELVALIDNELEEGRRTALVARLAADERLRQRYEEFRQTSAPLAASLDELLGQAPLARLRAALPAEEPPRLPSRRFSGIALRDLAAGIIGILAAGAAADRPPTARPGRRLAPRRAPGAGGAGAQGRRRRALPGRAAGLRACAGQGDLGPRAGREGRRRADPSPSAPDPRHRRFLRRRLAAEELSARGVLLLS